MTDRPIIMSVTSMRALLAEPCRKFQTRRALDPQPYPLEGRPGYWNASGCVGGRIVVSDRSLLDLHRKPAVGDRLWVREALHCPNGGTWWYRADDAPVELPRDDPRVPAMIAWAHHKETTVCSPIHMPRWASRATIPAVTEVRVERLQDIGQGDACAEGCPPFMEPCSWYEALWESLHGPGSWALNPWVCVVGWREVERRNIGEVTK